MNSIFKSTQFAIGVFTLAIVGAVAVGQPVSVPWGQCYDYCPHPHDIDPCCSPSWMSSTCTRTDSAPIIIWPGVLTYVPSKDFELVCANCCKWKPTDCPGNDINPNPRTCEGTTGITFTESITKTIGGSITVSMKAVELALEGGIKCHVSSCLDCR